VIERFEWHESLHVCPLFNGNFIYTVYRGY
jgi:hypothetical protein